MEDDVYTVLLAYPQVYLACHVEHRARGTAQTGLTSRDATILAHVAAGGTTPSQLARHLGIAASTLSPAVARLAALGLLHTEVTPSDRRGRRLQLTDAGRAAVAAGSVLNAERVAAVLGTLSRAERRRAVDGLATLATAARRFRTRTEARPDAAETHGTRGRGSAARGGRERVGRRRRTAP